MFQIKNLTKKYKNKIVLDKLNFSLSKNSFEALIGKSGSGKSTILSILVGLTKPTSGTVKFLNEPFRHGYDPNVCSLGYAPQEQFFDPNQTFLETLLTSCALWGIPKRKARNKIEDLIEILQMEEFVNTKSNELSGGNKKIISLMKAVVAEPKLLILDEPTAGLDVQKKQRVWNYLKAYHSLDNTILLVSHNWAEIQELCSYYSLLENGQVRKKEKVSTVQNSTIYQKFEIKLSTPFVSLIKNPYLCKQLSKNEIEVRLKDKQKISDLIVYLEKSGNRITFIKSKEIEPLEYLNFR